MFNKLKHDEIDKNYDLETINRNLPIFSTYEPGSTFKVVDTITNIKKRRR